MSGKSDSGRPRRRHIDKAARVAFVTALRGGPEPNGRTGVEPGEDGGTAMRMLALIPLLFAAGCNVETDARNDQTTVTIDRQGIANAAEDLGNVAEDSAAEIERAGKAVRNEARKIDVDVDVRRDGGGNGT